MDLIQSKSILTVTDRADECDVSFRLTYKVLSCTTLNSVGLELMKFKLGKTEPQLQKLLDLEPNEWPQITETQINSKSAL